MLNFYFNFKICFLIKNVIPFFENIHSCFIIITINIIRRKRIKKIRETFNGDHKFAVKNIYEKIYFITFITFVIYKIFYAMFF